MKWKTISQWSGKWHKVQILSICIIQFKDLKTSSVSLRDYPWCWLCRYKSCTALEMIHVTHELGCVRDGGGCGGERGLLCDSHRARTAPQPSGHWTSHCVPIYSMVAVARARRVSPMTNCRRLWHSGDSVASVAGKSWPWKTETCRWAGVLVFIYFCLFVENHQRCFFPTCSDSCYGNTTHLKLPLSLWDFSECLRGPLLVLLK